MSTFTYEVLQHGCFRLLDLLPGSTEAPIKCRLWQTDLRTVLRYECLSYTWGSSERSCRIALNDATFFVTRSLDGAMRTLRGLERVRRLWIDQLCIDQDNFTERAEQVQMMHCIYRGAMTTAVYLHVENKTDLEVDFDLSSVLLEAARSYKAVERRVMFRGKNPKNNAHVDGMAAKPNIDAILEMISHSWFSRVWILQELIMSRKLVVYYRGRTMDWYVLRACVWAIQGSAARNASELTAIQRMRQLASNSIIFRMPSESEYRLTSLWTLEQQTKKARLLISPYRYKKVKQVKLVRLLCTARGFQSTDPRDRVFALLNLTRRPQSITDYLQERAYRYVSLTGTPENTMLN